MGLNILSAIHGMSAISKLNTQSFLNLKTFRQQYFSISQLYMSTILIYQHIYTYIFYATYASKVRVACIVATYNDGSKATIRLSERGRSRLAFVTSGIYWSDSTYTHTHAHTHAHKYILYICNINVNVHTHTHIYIYIYVYIYI